MKGQMTLFEKAKAPIWHVSLNHVWEECPNCHAYNKAQVYHRSPYRGEYGYYENLERCPECGQLFDWSDEAIEKACKYSKDYLERRKQQECQNGNR